MATSKLLMASLTHYRPLTCAATYSSRLVPHPPDLIKWVKTEGGFVHPSIRLSQDGSHGLGLVASQDIPKGSPVIALPDHIPLKFGPFDGGLDGPTSVLMELASKVPEELWAMKLGLKLLQERARVGSFWWPYISNLPDTYNVPIFFQGEDIKNLQYAPLLYQVNKRCRFLLDFEQVLKHAVENQKPSHHPFGGQDVDASSLGWAMSAVSSRAFRLHGKKLPNGTHTDVPMMLPLIDMCNHSFDPNARIVQEQDSRTSEMVIQVVAETPIKENDTLQINYGNLNNDLFLLDYGFVMSPNPYDCIELRYDGALLEAASTACGIFSSTFSSPAQWQKEILSQLLLEGEPANLKVTIGGEEVVEGRLLAAVRVLLTSDMETMKKQDLETLKSLSADAPLGVANEAAALRVIIALCVIALEHFPTKVMEDESILKQDISDSAKLAIQYRIHKKHVFIDVMRDLTRRVKLLLSKDVATPRG